MQFMSIQKNLEEINSEIQKVCNPWNRATDEVNLVAVSKRQPQEKIKAALDAGHRLFGENKVQEAYEHWEHLKPQYPNLKLHLIGPLQTNKIKDAVKLFDCIETIDREKLARKLGNILAEHNKKLPCFVQVNTGEEEQKSGIAPNELSEFLNFCKNDCQLNITGLMCIPPIDDPAALHFAMLQKMAHKHKIENLSMGMSADYKHAIPLGATYIRVGTGIFGQREKS